jgi:hypothetical protein
MEEFTPNSHKYKAEQAAKAEEKKKITKVIQGTAKTKKKSGFSMFIESFTNNDLPDVKTYLISDLLVPTIKDAIINTVTMLLTGQRSTRKSKLNVDRVSYRDFYKSRYDDSPRSKESSARVNYSYDDIILDSRIEAEEVYSHMNDVIDEYDMISVGDLLDMVGLPSDYTDQKYGWTNISSARVERVRDGWRLDLPKAKPLN